MPIRECHGHVSAVTRGPNPHFFGYYTKTPRDAGGQCLLALEAPPILRMPKSARCTSSTSPPLWARELDG
jgi:hypothetical protein